MVQVFIFKTHNLNTFIWFKVFLSNNNLNSAIYDFKYLKQYDFKKLQGGTIKLSS